MGRENSVSILTRGVSFPGNLRKSVIAVSLLSAILFSTSTMSAFAGEALPPPTPSSSPSVISNTTSNPVNGSTMGQMMAMQQAAMGQSAQASSFDGNVPKSTSLSANFAWMDTFDNSVFNGGYGGGVTVTHWITSRFALQASIEIESFGLSNTNRVASGAQLPNQAGTPVIPITLGGLYDVTGGKNWVNPQIFLDGGPAVTLNGETMPLYFDIGAGVTTPLAKLSDTLAGIDLFANIRLAYLSNMGGLADSAVAVSSVPSAAPGAMNQNLFYMPIEFGATFVF